MADAIERRDNWDGKSNSEYRFLLFGSVIIILIGIGIIYFYPDEKKQDIRKGCSDYDYDEYYRLVYSHPNLTFYVTEDYKLLYGKIPESNGTRCIELSSVYYPNEKPQAEIIER